MSLLSALLSVLSSALFSVLSSALLSVVVMSFACVSRPVPLPAAVALDSASGGAAAHGARSRPTSRVVARDPDVDCAQVQIFVKTLSGKTIALDTNLNGTVDVVKSKIQAAVRVPSAEQRLIFSGIQLDVRRSLREYGVRKASTLHLVLRLRGGAPPLFDTHTCKACSTDNILSSCSVTSAACVGMAVSMM